MKLEYAVIQRDNGISDEAKLYLSLGADLNYIWGVNPATWEKEVAEENAKKYGGVVIQFNQIEFLTGH